MRGVIKLYYMRGPRTYPFFFIKKVCGYNPLMRLGREPTLIPFYTHAICLVTR